jgi:hypothetical protein
MLGNKAALECSFLSPYFICNTLRDCQAPRKMNRKHGGAPHTSMPISPQHAAWMYFSQVPAPQAHMNWERRGHRGTLCLWKNLQYLASREGMPMLSDLPTSSITIQSSMVLSWCRAENTGRAVGKVQLEGEQGGLQPTVSGWPLWLGWCYHLIV